MTTESSTAPPTPASSPLGALGVPGTHRELMGVNAVLDYLLEKFGPDAEVWIAAQVENVLRKLQEEARAKLEANNQTPPPPGTPS